MVVLHLAPAGLSLLLLLAHFLRAGSPAPMIACLALLVLLFVRRPLARRLIQAGLVLGGIEWVRTLLVLAAERQRVGVPAGRLAAILGSVAAIALLSALLLQSARSRRHFTRPESHRDPALPAG